MDVNPSLIDVATDISDFKLLLKPYQAFAFMYERNYICDDPRIFRKVMYMESCWYDTPQVQPKWE